MTTSQGSARRAGHLLADPPSMVALATEALRGMIVSGELQPGERVIENRLADQLGVSRPPLREAIKALESDGLVELLPRRGAVVRPLSLHDVFEIVTLRTSLESLAVRLGVPVVEPGRLDALRDAVELLEEHARLNQEDTAVEDSHRFHRTLVALSGHRRLEESYRAISLQLLVYMTMNRRARSGTETLQQRAARHRAVFDLVVEGNPEAVLDALHDDASLSFVRELGPSLPGGSPAADAWLARILSTD